MIETAGDDSALSLSRLDISPVAKQPYLSCALVIFEFKALCCIRLWKLYSNGWSHIVNMADGSIPAAEPSTFYAPTVVELYVYSLSNNTYACTHKKWNLKESFLSLLKEENDNIKDSEHPRLVSHIKIKLMTLQWLKFSLYHGLPGRVLGYYYIRKPTGLTCKFNLNHNPKPLWI